MNTHDGNPIVLSRPDTKHFYYGAICERVDGDEDKYTITFLPPFVSKQMHARVFNYSPTSGFWLTTVGHLAEPLGKLTDLTEADTVKVWRYLLARYHNQKPFGMTVMRPPQIGFPYTPPPEEIALTAEDYVWLKTNLTELTEIASQTCA